MTYAGCQQNMTQECADMGGAYFPFHQSCELRFECPQELVFQGCLNHECILREHFNGVEAQVGCEECKDNYHEVHYKNGAQICVPMDAENDCSADGSRPEGPEGCMRCIQFGEENLCEECDHTKDFELNYENRTCFERVHASEETFIVDCPETMPRCAVCRSHEEVTSTNEIATIIGCDACRYGFAMSTE